jgi:M.ahdI
MEDIKEILLVHGYSYDFLNRNLTCENLINGDNAWALKNSLNEAYILFIQKEAEVEFEILNWIISNYPMVGMIVRYYNAKILNIRIKRFYDNSFIFLNELEIAKYTQMPKSLLFGNKQKGYKALQPIETSIENLFFEAHSIVRDIDGLHPEEALDEICKFIYVKLYDEEINPKSGAQFIQRALYCTTEEAASIVRSLYKESTKYDERVYALRIPKYKKSRGVFDSNINLSSPALCKLIEVFECYDLTNSNIDVKGRAFQKMLLPAARAGMGQYFTPLPVIKFIVDVLSPNVDDLIIDPFSGSGHFLTQTISYVSLNENVSEKKMHEFKFYKLHGIEKSEKMVRISMTDMRLHGDGHSNIRCTDALLNFDNYEDLKENSFDLVMSNPPFGSILSHEAIERLGSFELMHGRKNAPLEILGLERCIQLLRPGGRFGIVLPESIFTNRNTKYVRDWLLKKVNIFGIIGLPLETFSPFGANIKTVILFGKKRKYGQIENKIETVVIGSVKSVGYNFKGQPTPLCDIDTIIPALKKYI